MKTLNYICTFCGNSIEIEYNENLIFDHIRDCPSCKNPINKNRLEDIIEDLLNPPANNPTQEYYTDKENNNDSKRKDT